MSSLTPSPSSTGQQQRRPRVIHTSVMGLKGGRECQGRIDLPYYAPSVTFLLNLDHNDNAGG